MKPLKNQLEFEGLLLPRNNKPDDSKETETLIAPRNEAESSNKSYDPYVCVQFSAAWCAPCKRIDKVELVEKYPQVTWYICDVDENDYTLGYCGMRKIPSFVFIRRGKFVGRLEGSSSTAAVAAWIDGFMAE
jgi:thioredoxin 1